MTSSAAPPDRPSEPPISGLRYVPGFISDADAGALLGTIDLQPWSTQLKRRVQHYGYRYDYRSRNAGQDTALGPIPDWLAPYVSLVSGGDGLDGTADQVIVNDYAPGQGISAHIDCIPCFGPRIAALSLGSTCAMRFSHPGSGAVVEVRLDPCSLLVLSGPARTDWQHEIVARKSDIIDGARFPRGRRVSVTFRTLRTPAT